MLHDGPLDERGAAVWEGDVAAVISCERGDAVAGEGVVSSARFEFMSFPDAPQKFAVARRERIGTADIDAVRLPAIAQGLETTVLDEDIVGGIRARENPFLPIVQINAANPEVCSFVPNARPVAIRDRHAGELEIFKSIIVALVDKNALAGAGLVFNVRPAADAPDSEVALGNRGAINIDAGVYFYEIAVSGGGDCLARQNVGLAGANPQGAGE